MEYQYSNIAILIFAILIHQISILQNKFIRQKNSTIQGAKKIDHSFCQKLSEFFPTVFYFILFYFNNTEYDWTTQTGIVSYHVYINLKNYQFDDLRKTLLTTYYFYSTIF